MDPRYAKKYTLGMHPRWSSLPIHVHLWKRDYTGPVTTLIGAKNALIIKGPSYDLEAPVKARGGTLRLISNGDRDLLDLYSADPMHWIIEIVNDSQEIIFLGYLEAELYEEPFGRTFNYEVSVQFNDMLSILERLPYVDENGEPYRGYSSLITILSRIFSKLSRSHTAIDYMGVDRTYSNDTYNLSALGSQNNTQNGAFMNKVIFNSDNYIDEDGISFSCRKVLETVMLSQSMCLITHGDKFRIMEPFMFRTKAEPDFRMRFLFNSSTNTFSTVNTGFTYSGSHYLLLGSHIEGQFTYGHGIILDASFSIVPGFNKYIVEKDRYIKPIIEPEEFDGGDPYRVFQLNQYSFDPNWSQVTAPGGPGNDDYIYYWEKWIAVYASFGEENWVGVGTSMLNIPQQASTNFYTIFPTIPDIANINPNTVSFYGGIKDVLVVDGVQIDWTEDDRDFTNYLFINNPTEPFDGDGSTYVDYDTGFYEHDITAIGRTAATYEAYVPYVYSSQKVLLHFYFTGHIVKIANSATIGNVKGFSGVKNEFTGTYYVYMARIFAYDSAGNIIAYLKNEALNVTTQTDKHPIINGVEINRNGYMWHDYLGTETFHTLCCKIVVANQNEAFNPQYIDNMDVPIHIYANAYPTNTIYRVAINFTNLYYEVYNDAATFPIINLQSWIGVKQNNIYFGIRNIGINVVSKETLEEIPYEDEEFQFYLSETYKTEEKKETFMNYAGDDTFITDVGGYMIEKATANELVPILSCSSAASIVGTFPNMLHSRGEMLLRHYSQNRIRMTVALKGSLPITYQFHNEYIMAGMMDWQKAFIYPTDSKWSDKKFGVIDFSLNLDSGVLNVTLEEYK